MVSNYTEKVIDLDNILTLSFNSGGGTRTLVESADNFMKSEESKKKDIIHVLKSSPFWGSKIRYKYEWEEILKQPFKYKKYYSVTVNMDPSKIGYENKYSVQKVLIFDTIYEYMHKIKYLALIYEHGKSKLHWHMLVNIKSIKEFEQTLQTKFGRGRAVVCKKVEPNHSETLNENLFRLLNYFRKENHNKELCLLSKT